MNLEFSWLKAVLIVLSKVIMKLTPRRWGKRGQEKGYPEWVGAGRNKK